MKRLLPLLAVVAASCALLDALPAAAQMPLPGAEVAKSRRAGTISEADLRVAGASMDEGRAALKTGKFQNAITLFNKVLGFPENQYSAEAQELLGFARQKNGQPAEARGIWEDYLRRYPDGEGNDRVKQRLAGLVTKDDRAAVLRDGPGPVKDLPIGKFTKTNESTWTLTGSVSSFYIRDDSNTQARDTAVAPNVNANADDHLVQQNEIFTTLDLLATWNDDHTSGKVRFSGGEEHRFGAVVNAPTGDQVDQWGVAQASLDMVQKDLNLRTVVGRQTFNGDGVFGRFDGALFSWQALPMMKVDLIGGSPANSRFNLPFTNERWFSGGGLDFGPMFGGLDTSIYYNEERGRWLVDREAVGTDIKYGDPTKFMFANVDYDILFMKLNEATVTGSWTLPTQTTVYGGANYERVPFLSSWNVLLNSGIGTLYDFLKAQTALGNPLTMQQVNQLALEQTPVYKSVMVGASHPVNEHLTLSADATIANLSQAFIPTAALDPSLATLASGNEYYATVQAIFTNMFKTGDMFIAAFHYTQQTTDQQYELDFNTRYPINADLMIAPRLRLGYELYSSGALLYPAGSNTSLPPIVAATNITEYTASPSILLDWNITPQLQFETEVGVQYTYSAQVGAKTNDFEYFGTIGFRYTFDLDGSKVFDHSKPSSPATAAVCRYSLRPDGSCVAPNSTAEAARQSLQ